MAQKRTAYFDVGCSVPRHSLLHLQKGCSHIMPREMDFFTNRVLIHTVLIQIRMIRFDTKCVYSSAML